MCSIVGKESMKAEGEKEHEVKVTLCGWCVKCRGEQEE